MLRVTMSGMPDNDIDLSVYVADALDLDQIMPVRYSIPEEPPTQRAPAHVLPPLSRQWPTQDRPTQDWPT